ncbi:hypothetical protein [Bacillus sp. V33-4]|nr:hypothetical protein [Bacillus sp. V33-4]PLR87778.1 hypothetical protein CVD23_00940 [Bacillus sp. V33-4]
MTEVAGVITVQQHKGSDVLLIDGKPVSKVFSKFNGKMVTLHIDCGFEFSQTVKGTAEVFYFEGTQQFHRGLKYVNDFFVEDDDIIELLVKHEGKKLKLTATIL